MTERRTLRLTGGIVGIAAAGLALGALANLTAWFKPEVTVV